MLKKALWGVLVLVLALVSVLAVNTWRKGSRQIQVAPLAPVAIDETAVAQRLGEAVRLKTISTYQDPRSSWDEFQALHRLLEQRFPRVHASLKRETIGDLSLLYTWPGTQTDAPPMLLLAHQDVVPIAPGTEERWTNGPFSGAVKEGFVWGRGAWDNKGNLMSQLEAVEMLLASGFQPERTVYLFLGADEEVGGERGAVKLAQWFAQRKIELGFVLDEGLFITDGVMPGLKQRAALIGIAEKGYLSVVLKFNTAPGHSSQPPRPGTSAIGMMSAAVKRLDDHQLPSGIRGVAAEMFDTLAPEMQGFGRVALSNLWLFGPLVQKQLEAGAATQAMLRTTTAPTIVSAGNKDNVLPGVAEATVNFRLLPGDTKISVMEHVRQQVGQVAPSEKFELYALEQGGEASPVSPVSSTQYHLLNRTVREVFPDVVVSPGLMIGGTDSKHLASISRHIFKFSPISAKPEDLPRFHGTNERLSVTNYADAIRFYHRLLTESSRAANF